MKNLTDTIVVTAINPKTKDMLHSFVYSLRQHHDWSLICYCVNLNDTLVAHYQQEFPTVEFRTFNSTLIAKDHISGEPLYDYLVPQFLKKIAFHNNKSTLLWLSVNQVVRSSLESILQYAPEEKYCLFRDFERKGQPTGEYSPFIHVWRSGSYQALHKFFKTAIRNKEYRCAHADGLYDVGGKKSDKWPCLTKASTNVSSYTSPLFFKDFANHRKGRTEVLTKTTATLYPEYQSTFDSFAKKKPGKIIGYTAQSTFKWCFHTTMQDVAKHLGKEIKIYNGYHTDFKNNDFDIFWCRGASYLMEDIAKKVPGLAAKTVSTITTGAELLDGRIDKILKSQGVHNLAFVAQHEDAKMRMEYALKQKGLNTPVYVIPNGVDRSVFKPMPEKRPSKFVVGFAGRTKTDSDRKQKGIALVERACELLGVELKQVSNKQGERLDHEDMPEFLNSISCLILPSNAEGCSNTCLEAQACGTPVVTTPIAYHGEVCRDGYDILFCQRSLRDICEKLQWLRDNPDRAEEIGQNGYEFAAKHDITIISKMFADMFDEILEKRLQ